MNFEPLISCLRQIAAMFETLAKDNAVYDSDCEALNLLIDKVEEEAKP